jgi:hypothetical protein
MKKFLFFLILPLRLFSQTEIDQVRSDSDVVNFIRTMGPAFVDSIHRPYFKPVTFDIFGRIGIYKERMNPDDAHFTDSITARRWIVEDLTGDNQKDLVYYGKIGNMTGVYVLYNGTGNSKHLAQLTDMFAGAYPHSIELYKKANENLLILGSVEHGIWRAKVQKPIRERYFRDTLVYKFGYFANYNEHPKPGPSFDSIDYRFITNWASIEKWYLRIYKNGTILYVRERDSVDRQKKEVYSFLEKLTAKTDTEEWRSLLGYIKFDSLSEQYELKDVSDQITGLTTVYYSNGTKKTVRDYGLRGTFGLQTLYQKLYVTTQRRDWQLIRKITGYMHNNPQF